MALGHRIPSADRRKNALKCEKTLPKRSPANGYSKDIKDADTQATFGLDSHVNGQNTEMPQHSRIHSKNGPSIGSFEHPKIGISKMQILRPLLDCIHTSMGKTLKCPSIAESTQKMALVSGSLSIPKIDPPKSVLDTEVDLPRYATHQKVYWILR